MQLEFIAPTAKDINEFARLSIKTYRDTFAADNDPSELERYLSTTFTAPNLNQLLEDPNYHIWFLHHRSHVAGYFTLRDHPCPYETVQSAHPIEIHRFYIDGLYQGSGFGKQMMAFCLEQAKLLGADTVWLGVWEENQKAQQFYKKHGFNKVGQHDFWVGNDCQNDFLMQKRL